MSCCLFWSNRPPCQLVIQSGSFSSLFKSVSVTPLLKKPGLDKCLPSNYRPIFNLNTISKVLEHLFLNRVQSSVVSSPNFNQSQNAYRSRHSTETCLLATLNNSFTCSYSVNSTLLVSLDHSATFDIIDHAIHLSPLKTSFGFDGLVYHWIESYLTDRSQTVAIGNNSCAPTHVTSGVPQGSVNRLQRIQNALARCVLDSKVHRSSNALLHQLHWLPIH